MTTITSAASGELKRKGLEMEWPLNYGCQRARIAHGRCAVKKLDCQAADADPSGSSLSLPKRLERSVSFFKNRSS